MAEHQGELVIDSHKVAIVVSRFNSVVTQALLVGARDVFLRHGGEEDHLDVIWVPGAFEIPGIARRAVQSGRYDGVLTLGALIKGGTPHFEVLAQQVTSALVDLAATGDLPVGFGILTTQTVEQALERAGLKAGNKGAEAMLGLIETMNLHAKLA